MGWSCRFAVLTNKKLLGLKVSCVSYMATLLIIQNGPFVVWEILCKNKFRVKDKLAQGLLTGSSSDFSSCCHFIAAFFFSSSMSA